MLRAPLTLIAAAALSAAATATAGNVQIQVLDREGKPVADAVVVLYPPGGGANAPTLVLANPTVEQEKMRFVPAVTVVAPGSTVRFTNQDRWDHHVRGTPTPGGVAPAVGAAPVAGFELRLSGKEDTKPASQSEIKVGGPGVVLLGCHLHGSMRGHLFVTDSPWTLKTDADGIARFAGVPEGATPVQVWHGEQLVDLPRKVLQVVPTPVLDTVQLSVVPRRRRASPPAGGPTGGYSQVPVPGLHSSALHAAGG